jgi:hypothetical protein
LDFTGLVFGVGLVGVVAAVSNFPRLALLAVARRDRIGERLGLLATVGTVESASGTVETPFRGESAVCYTYRVLENDTDDDPDPDDETNWGLAAVGEEGVPFSVVAAGERIRVEPDDASFHLDGSETVAVLPGDDPPAEVRSFLAADVDAGTGIGRRYEESVLTPGDSAFVLGPVADEGTTVVRGGLCGRPAGLCPRGHALPVGHAPNSWPILI